MEAATQQSKRVYVGNLPWTATNDDIKKHFSSFKLLEAEVQRKLTGKSKGFALIEFETTNDANNAISTLNNTKIGERDIVLRFDRLSLPETRSKKPTASAASSAASAASSSRLFVGNLPWSVKDDVLKSFFSDYKVSAAYVQLSKGNSRSRGFGLVTFESPSEAARALKEKGEFEYEGRQVFLKYDRRQ
eukprot:c2178_g1_i1.p1 GENE.c2178_g1_i1~~c2178_g1_i1.p1  ORF type:complete len:189 (+),score=26.39 c2178_g1_i1:50-616(+)